MRTRSARSPRSAASSRRSALCLALLALAGCGDEVQKAPSATKHATTPFPVDFAFLKPGVTYTSRNFKPSISFKTPPGHWRAAVADHADHVELEPDTVPPLAAAGIAFHHATQVFPPDKGGKIAGDAVAGPENFATWLTSHPHLKTTQPKPVAALGLEGVSIDVRAKSSSPRKYKDCGKFSGACVVLMMGGVEPILYAGEILGRFLVLEQPDGKQLVVEEWFEPASAAEVGFKLLDQAVANARFVGG